MNGSDRPAVSVILLVPARFDTVARTVSAVAAQPEAGRIELVVVSPVEALHLPGEAVERFQHVTRVHHPEWRSTSDARAAGIRAASAPVVALVEDHCYPAPGWAAALIAAHAGTWTGVGPVILNANPATVVSWANLVIEYGPWLAAGRGPCSHIPGHNSSYKREALLAFGDRLGELMEAESVLQWELARQGHVFAMEPDARSRHENFSVFPASLGLRFHGGRLFAANRARGWSLARRVLFAAGCPALPFLRTWRALGHLQVLGDTRPRPMLVPMLFVLLAVDAVGEFAGYALGGGSSMLRLTDLEFDRQRFLCARDRTLAGS